MEVEADAITVWELGKMLGLTGREGDEEISKKKKIKQIERRDKKFEKKRNQERKGKNSELDQ